jgi:hypothetical protein
MKKIPSTQIRALFEKLSALAERGINGEKKNAEEKLRRLQSRFDFKAKIKQDNLNDIFAGKFPRAPYSSPVATVPDNHVAISVKHAIEFVTGISCRFNGAQLLAETTPASAKNLAGIVFTISESFNRLWEKFKETNGVFPADRPCFIQGLCDGLLNEARAFGQPLPQRALQPRVGKAKRKSLAPAPGLSLHPYTVALPLGKSIRFSVPLVKIENELSDSIKQQLVIN